MLADSLTITAGTSLIVVAVLLGVAALAHLAAEAGRRNRGPAPTAARSDQGHDLRSVKAIGSGATTLMTQEVLKTRPAAEWLERLTAEGVPCAPVLTRSAMIRDPQVQANGIVVETEHEDAGLLRQARPAARFSVTPASIRHGGRALGADTEAVLAEIGYSATEIAALRTKEHAA